MSEWEKDGKTFSKYYLRGKDLQFLGSKKKDDAQGDSNDTEVPF